MNIKFSKPTIEIELKKAPKKHNFTRFISFVNSERKAKRLKVKFSLKEGLKYEAKSFPDGLNVLESFLQEENRSHWDKMVLENRGGKVPLDIARIKFVLHYQDKGKKGKKSIPIINGRLKAHLPALKGKVLLNPVSIRSKYKLTGVGINSPYFLRQAVQDLGKYGISHSLDISGLDGKTSPFDQSKSMVLGYYIDNQVEVGEYKFSAEENYSDVPGVFRKIKRLASYNKGRKSFVSGSSRKVVNPKEGDYLEERGENPKSYILLKWDDENKQASVLSGPFPVTREVIKFLDLPKEHPGFWLGSI